MDQTGSARPEAGDIPSRTGSARLWRVPGLFLVGGLLAGSGLLLVFLLVGCRKPASPVEPVEAAWFEEVTAEVGIDFVHDAGPVDEKYFMPQITGSGSALFDFDGDGRLDILLLNNGGPKGRPNRLFKQMPDGTFKDVSKGSGLDFSGYCQGVAIGDVNNDGFPDVLVTEYTGVRLFLNNGNGTFTDVTERAGLRNPLWATSACFVDYDRDGWLDLVVVNYVDFDAARSCFERTASATIATRSPSSAPRASSSATSASNPAGRFPAFASRT